MLSIGQVSPQGFEYYSDNHTKSENYYSAGTNKVSQSNSIWFGKGASALKLKGDIENQTFDQLIKGKLPNDIQLGRINKEGQIEHRPGYDLTFSAPKSVSILIEVLEQKDVETAHSNAVISALKYIEENAMQTREINEIDQEQKPSPTNNMIAGIFKHNLSRENEPATHSHAVVLNATQRHDGKWRSLEPIEIFRQKMLIGAIYRSELASNLQKSGYEIDRTSSNGLFEVRGIPASIIKAFSTRRKQILAFKEKNPNASPARLADAAKLTRSEKSHTDLGALKQEWLDTIHTLGFKVEELSEIRKTPSPPLNSPSEKHISRAISALSERHSVFNLKTLKERAIQYAVGHSGHEDILNGINQKFAKQELLIGTYENKAHLVTTPALLQLEKDTLEAVFKHQNESLPHPSFQISNTVSKAAGLADEQAKVVETAMSSGLRYFAVQGFAGTGKSTTLSTLSHAVERNGYNLIAMAPTSSATNNLKEEGLKAQTLSSFLQQFGPEKYTSSDSKLQATYVVLDEASMVSTKDMKKLVDICNTHKAARVILVGDTAQLDSVQAGNPFLELQKHGLPTLQLEEIRRQNLQKDRDAIMQFIKGDIRDSIESISDKIQESEFASTNETTARTWLSLEPQTRQHTSIIASTHKELENITGLVREGLKHEGVIHSGIQLETLKSLSLEVSERSNADNYLTGQVLFIRRKDENLGIRANSHYEIQAIQEEHLTLLKDGQSHTLPLSHSAVKHSELYEKKIIELGIGDKVHWTRNDVSRRFINSDQALVTHITEKDIHYKNEKGDVFSIPHDDKNGRHVGHAWATTIHAAQGRSINNVIAQLDAYNPTLTNQKSFYTTISRFKENLTLITNDKAQLIDTIEETTGQKIAAQDVQIEVIDSGKEYKKEALHEQETEEIVEPPPPEIEPSQPSRDYDFER